MNLNQKKKLRKLAKIKIFNEPYKPHSRNKSIIFVPEKGEPIAYANITAMVAATGLSKSKLLGGRVFLNKGQVALSSIHMNKIDMKGYIISADKEMLIRMRMAPVSSKQSKIQRRILESQIPEAPTNPIMTNATALQQAVGVI